MPASPDGESALSQVYVLRLWRERAGVPWRAALRPADGAAPIGFGNLEQLAAFLLRLPGSRDLSGGEEREGSNDKGS